MTEKSVITITLKMFSQPIDSDLETSVIDYTDSWTPKKNNITLETSILSGDALFDPVTEAESMLKTSKTLNQVPVRYNSVDSSAFLYQSMDFRECFDNLFPETVRLYAVNQINKKIKKSKSHNTMKANSYVNENELLVFLGIIIFFSMQPPKNYKEIWKTDTLTYNNYIANKMSYSRFKFLHARFTFFSKKDKKDGKIIKKPKILNSLIAIYKKYCIPGENISIDESICPFKGRTLNKVYCKEKPAKFGVKFYSLCDSATSYLLDLQIVGEQEVLNSLVRNMTTAYGDEWRIVHMDNLYNSVKTCHDLYQMKIHTNGTFRFNRGVSKELMSMVPEKFHTITKKIDEICQFYVYHDNKIVKFISTVYGDCIEEKKGLTWSKDKKTGKKQKKEVVRHIPKAIISYNSNMNGVDKFNQSLSYIHLLRKTKRWDQRLSLYLFETVIHNAYILWKPVNMAKKSKYKFMSLLAEDLVEYKREQRHQILHLCDKSDKSQRCVTCHKNGKRSETNHFCTTCKKFLHTGECFKTYHLNLTK